MEARFRIYPSHLAAEKKRARTKDEIKVLSLNQYKELHKILSPVRLKILAFLRKEGEMTISKLSEKLGRDYKNVHADIKSLAQHGLVNLRKEGNKLKASTPFRRISVTFYFYPFENDFEFEL